MLRRLFTVQPADDLSAGEKAGEYFDQGFNCAQAVLKANGENPDAQLLEIAKSFGAGIAGAKCLCGAISGGVMALSLRGAGKVSDKLVAEFKRRHRTTCCAGLSRSYRWKSVEHQRNCRELTVSAAEITEQILRGKKF